ncbi:uncharacterized protein SPSK_07568 [Sporothrix schenckii 1099-18]|uniref:F-box domain-containing protein n=2 Tax=Sporothrix schenckii TaxID=29908 RepID=U7Q1S0_SPOS1|nr:uncharacterized protein SPSK_07568 [Sporothrix schenckii 1099-18]ERT00915.1 hypothetical protein HMPREF1624_02149 [Sporothrix schenckii ATCC 58251]KJR88022.1 hypothetical protein SPSK_07568 [Sporothrix schenckii 1099-18]
MAALIASTTTANSASTSTPEVASWQDVGYRCPRPGFFLGDDGSMATAKILTPSNELPAKWNMGRLSVLPLELMHQIVDDLAETDIRALVALRNCNRASAAVVDSFPDFATVAAFPRALGALVRLAPPSPTNSSQISLRALARCLRTTSCASCLRQREAAGDISSDVPYGDFIYLLAPERVCYSCFRSLPEYLPVARFAAAGNHLPQLHQQHKDLLDSQPLTRITVPPGRYGVLARLTQPVDLFDRREVYAAEEPAGLDDEGSSSSASSSTSLRNITTPEVDRVSTVRGRPVVSGKRGLSVSPTPGNSTRPDPLRYAAVIPAPYWALDNKTVRPTAETPVDRGYACRACAQTDRKSAGHAGWADPLARYTEKGLQRHVADPRYGGRVLRRRVGLTDIYEHDAPRRGHFPPPVEFGATADLARRYEAVILVPAGSVVGSRM